MYLYLYLYHDSRKCLVFFVTIPTLFLFVRNDSSCASFDDVIQKPQPMLCWSMPS